MTKLFLSDLHLGSPLFRSTSHILDLLNRTLFDEIFFVGDIIDEWEKDVLNIVIEHSEIISTINYQSMLKPINFIIGNHDPSKDILEKIFNHVNFYDSLKFNNGIIIHGHQFSIIYDEPSIWSKILYSIYWLFERIGIDLLSKPKQLLFSLASKFDDDDYPELVLSVEEGILEAYKNKYEFAITGHTHMPKIINHPELKFINCGDWTHNKTYVTLNVNNEFILHKI